MIVVVDTSVWVSALINPKGFPGQVLRRLEENHFNSATSRRILLELEIALQRPRIGGKYGLTADQISKFTRLIEARSILVSSEAPLKLCRDADDDHILATAIAAKAEYLVTRDDDLKDDSQLVAKCRANGVQIVSVRRFLRIFSH